MCVWERENGNEIIEKGKNLNWKIRPILTCIESWIVIWDDDDVDDDHQEKWWSLLIIIKVLARCSVGRHIANIQQ